MLSRKMGAGREEAEPVQPSGTTWHIYCDPDSFLLPGLSFEVICMSSQVTLVGKMKTGASHAQT